MLPANMTLSYDTYAYLVSVALASTSDPGLLQRIYRMIQDTETRNGLFVDRVHVRWVSSSDTPHPPVRFPKEWPPSNEAYLEVVGRPAARQDVLDLISKNGGGVPSRILLTRDLTRQMGWFDIDAFFNAGDPR
jgi:hypothetical protein